MKQRHFKALTSLILVVVMLASMLPAIPVTVNAADEETYVKVDLADIQPTDVVIIVATKSTTSWALSSANGSSSAPTAVVVDTSGDQIKTSDTNILWNISKDGNNYTFYPNGVTDKWLYCTSSNNGVRVGTNANKIFTLDDSSGYFKNTATSRYLGVYTTNPDWRCYTNTTGNTADQSFSFYKLSTGESGDSSCEHTNTVAIGENKAATCTEPGSEAGVQCADCEKILIAVKEIPATGHNYVDGVCSVCDAEQPAGLDGRYYIATIRSSGNYWYMTNDLGTASTKRYQAVDSGLTTLPSSISAADANKANIFVLVQQNDGTYLIYAEGITEDNKYLGWSSGNSGALVAESSAKKFTVEAQADGTYHISFENGSETRYLQLNSSTSANYFAFYTSDQAKKLTLIPVEDPCTHANTTTTTVPATCTEAGSTTVICDKCGDTISTTPINPLGHDWAAATCIAPKTCNVCGAEEGDALGHQFADGTCGVCGASCDGHEGGTPTCTEQAKCDNCGQSYGDLLPHTKVVDEAVAPTCTKTGLTEGSHCAVCGEVLVAQTTVEKLPHTEVVDAAVDATCTEDGKTEGSHCSVCNEVIVAQTTIPAGHNYENGVCTKCGATVDTYVLVTDASSLKAGDKIVIVGAKESTDALGTNQKSSNRGAGTVTITGNTLTIDENVQVITLEAGTTDGTFALNVGDGYLYAASSSGNQLKTKSEIDANGSWTIVITDGVASIVAAASSNRNVMQYNPNNGSPLFACYASASQTALQIYKLAGGEAPEWTGYSATLNGGITINVEYDISADWIAVHPDAKVAFVFADGVELAGSTPVAPTAGKTTYSFTLTPQAIDKQLYFVITEGETEIARSEVSYSIYKAELDKVADQHAGLSDLLSSIDTFTATANDKTNTVEADESIKAVADWAPATSGSILKSVNVSLGQQITANITVDTTIDYTGYKVTVTLGDVSLLTEADFTQYITSERKLVVKGLAPTHLNDTLTVTVYNAEGNKVASTSFNINSYLKTLYETDEEFKNLAAATYNYGIAAEAYAGN